MNKFKYVDWLVESLCHVGKVALKTIDKLKKILRMSTIMMKFKK